MIYITDGQSDKILDIIPDGDHWDDPHRKSLKDTVETFDFKTFGDKSYSEHLAKKNRVIIPEEDGTFQEFIIDNTLKYRNNQTLITEVYTSASYIGLKKAKVIKPQSFRSLKAESMLNIAVADTGYKVGKVESNATRTIHIEQYTNPYDFIKRIATEFGLEVRFRIVVKGRRILGRYVDLLERIGVWRGRTAEFGKDLIGIERREDFSNLATALFGLGPEREDGTRLEVFVEDKKALQRWGRRNPETGELMHIIDVYEPGFSVEEPSEDRLRVLTENELEKRVNSVVEYTSLIADLENVPGLEHEKIRFGDTIRTKDTGFNPPLYLEARVHTQERYLSDPSKKQVTLGDYIEYTEEEANAAWKALQQQINERLSKMVIVNIVADGGIAFKNGQGSTDLKAVTYLQGQEVDSSGLSYEYTWQVYDKNGNLIGTSGGKQFTVHAKDIDEKGTYIVKVSDGEKEMSSAVVTVTNVFDGEQGPQGPQGPKGDKGDPGPQGPPGTSVVSIVEYYLATDQSSGVTRSTPGWTTTMQQMTPTKKYLWNYEKINFSDGSSQNTKPVIIGVYGDKGETGRSITSIKEYYLATNLSSGVTRDTSGWTSSMQVTTPTKKYLWNYEEITWSSSPTVTYTDPVIIGVHGEQGPKGEDGKTFYTWIKYADTPTSGMSDNPEGKEYIGIAYNKETPTPSTNYADYVWSKFKGEQGVPGPPGEDGQPTYTWVKYADDENGNGMSDSPHDKLYIGLAFNKTTPTESNNPSDYTWSLMPQNIEIGGRNLITLNSVTRSNTVVDGYKYTLTKTSSSGNPYIRIPYTLFENNAEYVITFKAKKISGNVYRLAGHSTLARHETVRLFIDGIEQTHKLSSGWSNVGTANFPNDNEVHRYEIRFKTVSDVASVSTPYWYIQPNRPQYDSDSFVIEIWDWKLEKGNKATDWTPAPEDVEAEIEKAKQDAQNAQSTADGKNTVFYQSSAPSTVGRKVNDIWFDTDDGYTMYRFDGSLWVKSQIGHQAIASLDLGKATVGKLRGQFIETKTLEAGHIKSLNGLNIGDGQFVVDSSGNVTLKGNLEGATGTFSGDLTSSRLTIGPEEPYLPKYSDGSWAIRIKSLNRITDGVFEFLPDILIESLNGGGLRFSKEGYDLDVDIAGDLTIKRNQIAFSGSNSNGHYIRFYDGTQICFSTFEIPGTGAGRYYGDRSFPASFQFSDSNSITVLVNAYSSHQGAGTYGGFSTAATSLSASTYRYLVNGDGLTNTGHVVRIQVIAIGRWY